MNTLYLYKHWDIFGIGYSFGKYFHVLFIFLSNPNILKPPLISLFENSGSLNFDVESIVSAVKPYGFRFRNNAFHASRYY